MSDRIEYILNILNNQDHIKFSALFEESASRAEIVTTFLALLELIRLKQIVAYQAEEFGEIEIYRPVIVETIQPATHTSDNQTPQNKDNETNINQTQATSTTEAADNASQNQSSTEQKP